MSVVSIENRERRLRQLRWLLMPFGVVLGLPVVIGLAVITPIAMIQGWLHERRATRQLRMEGRLITLADAIPQIAIGNRELVAEFGKAIRSIWLVQVPPSDSEILMELPTYALFKCNARGAWTTLTKTDRAAMCRLTPYMQKAARVQISPKDIATLPDPIKNSMRMICMWDELSPSNQLNEKIAD